MFPETHTFRNLMENPLAVVLYLSANDFTSYECAPSATMRRRRLILSRCPKPMRIRYRAGSMCSGYSSHQVDHKFPGMIFYVVEAFDNSMMAGTGEGTRVVKIKEGIKNMYARQKTG